MTQHTAPAEIQLAVPPSLAPLVSALAASPELQARLGPLVMPDEFVAATRKISVELGLTFDEATLRDSLRPDPLGISRWSGAPLSTASWPQGDWLPARSIEAAPPQFDWAWFGPQRLTDPFYEDSVRREGSRPLSLLMRTRTTLDAVLHGAQSADSLPLSGLIFHMSRCGSTLLARILASLPQHIVASEPEPLDAVLRWAYVTQTGRDEAIAAVRAIVAAIGRRRDSSSRRLFIKLDAWHALSLPLLRAAFPDVPWVYLYRDPTEVMVSVIDLPGLLGVPGALPETQRAIPDGETLSRVEYCARALALPGKAVIENWSLGGGMAVDYAQLKQAALDTIPAHFGFLPDSSEIEAMRAAAGEYSKRPAEAFTGDSQRKQSAATAELRAAVRTHLASVHDGLGVLNDIF
ncbi:MAG TPA: sulfotransferase [Novosphingobium sp.]|nr:sulfotransferase [Novosphingobium sp.]